MARTSATRQPAEGSTNGDFEATPRAAAPLEEKMDRLAATLREQMAEGARLDKAIDKNLEELGHGA
jgi:hypothetical protein